MLTISNNTSLLKGLLSSLIGIILFFREVAIPISLAVHGELLDSFDAKYRNTSQPSIASTIFCMNCSPLSMPVVSIHTENPVSLNCETTLFTILLFFRE